MIAAVIESHHGRSDGYTALLLDLHPVGGSGLADLVTLHRTRYVDSTAVEQQFLRQRRLTRIRVRDDGERAAS